MPAFLPSSPSLPPGMLGLVVSDNLLMLFIFWEIMGFCSYSLIGFWYDKTYPDPKRITPSAAGVKAFMTTRVGDVLFLLGIAFLYTQTGTLNFREIMDDRHCWSNWSRPVRRSLACLRRRSSGC